MNLGKLESVTPIGAGKLALEFDDGQRATLDLMPLIRKRANLAPLASGEIFQRAKVSDDGWSVEWLDAGIDFGVNQLRRWADEQSGRTMSAERFRDWMERNKLTLDTAALSEWGSSTIHWDGDAGAPVDFRRRLTVGGPT